MKFTITDATTIVAGNGLENAFSKQSLFTGLFWLRREQSNKKDMPYQQIAKEQSRS
jgi:hypothetical protein